MKKILMVLVGVLFAVPAAASAQAYGDCSYFSFCGQELVVYAKGPVYDYHPSQRSPQQMYYQQPQYYQPTYYAPQGNYYNYDPYALYYTPQYTYYPQSYGYGGYGSYPVPLGTTNLLGQQLCDWGNGYRGYDCNHSHPAQYIYDPYSGTWY
jgi:hypothetical protein